METETIFRCSIGEIFRFYEAFCGDFPEILSPRFYLTFTDLIEIIWKIDSSELSSLSPFVNVGG